MALYLDSARIGDARQTMALGFVAGITRSIESLFLYGHFLLDHLRNSGRVNE